MGKKTHIDVQISVESIRDSLRKRIVSEHSQLISDVIIGNLMVTEVGLEQLFQAFSGIQNKFKYKVGDWVFSTTPHLYTWKFSESDMEAAGLMLEKRVKAQIVEIDPYKALPYLIEYKWINGAIEDKQINAVSEDQLCIAEEWPEKLSIDNDLPF